MRVALFLTAELEPARALLAVVRRRHDGDPLTVFVRDEHREPLAAALLGCDVRRDKPAGGKLAFVRALRRERFDELVVAWHGGDRLQPLRLAALFCGARAVVAADEHGRERRVALLLPWTWAGHAVRRLVRLRALTWLRALAALYRATVGLLVAGAMLVPTLLTVWLGGKPGHKA